MHREETQWECLGHDERHLFENPPMAESHAWIQARIALYERRILALRSAYNRASMINRRLPPEILIEIFSAMHHAKMHDVQISHVCRLWRRLIMHSPSFWASFLSDPDATWCVNKPREQERLEMLLRRSAPRPVAFAFLELTPRAYVALEPHVGRISSLKVDFASNCIPSMCKLLMHGMAVLEELIVSHYGDIPPDEEARAALRTFASRQPVDNLPRLKRLQLPRVMLDMHFPASPVSELSVDQCSCDSCADNAGIDKLLKLIQRHPSLERFSFLPITAQRTTFNTAPGTTVQNWRLNHLEVACSDVSWVSTLLSRLRTSPHTTINIHELVPYKKEEIIPAALHSLPIVSSAERIHMRFYHKERHDYAVLFVKQDSSPDSGPKPRLSLTVNLPPRRSLHRNVLDAFLNLFSGRAGSTKSLHIAVGTSGFSSETVIDSWFKDMLHVFDHITTLNMIVVRTATHLRLMGLLRGSDADTGTGADRALLCPRLATLALGWVVYAHKEGSEYAATWDEMETMLRIRAERGARLKRFEISWRWPSRSPSEPPCEVEANIIARYAPWTDRVSTKMMHED